MNVIYYIVLFFLSFVIFYLFRVMFRADSSSYKNKPIESKEEKIRPCPLCGELLTKSEKVHSVLYPGKADRLMEIFGCPYCYPPGKDKNKRICPSCKSVLGDKDYVSGRMFEKPGKKHLHVNGCPKCRKRIH